MEHKQMNNQVMYPAILPHNTTSGQSPVPQMNQKLLIQPHAQGYPQGYPRELLFPPSPTRSYPPSLCYNHHYRQQLQQHQQKEQQYWEFQNQKRRLHEELEADFKSPALPLARIKRIIRADEDVRMIAQETPVLFNKACEMFIVDLMQRSWKVAEENKRRTVNKNDVFQVVRQTEIFDFLDDIVPLPALPRSSFHSKSNADAGGSNAAA